MVARAFGSWPSPIPASMLTEGATLPSDVHAAADGTVWWSQSRPDQGGRQQVVRRDVDGTVTDALPDGFNARTRVHEYGGGAWWVHGGTVFACSWTDQRVHRCDDGVTLVALTPEPPIPHGYRYADGVVSPDGSTIVCVRETHDAGATPATVRNELVAFSATEPGEVTVLASGRDFVAAPRISRDGTRLAWITWDHPNMPWDSTELWVAELDAAARSLRDAHRIAGGADESLVQPEWGPDGTLSVVSDRSDWWNVHRVVDVDVLTPVVSVDAEIGRPAWVFGQSRYVVLDDGSVWMTYSDGGGAVLRCGDGVVRLPGLTSLSQLRVAGPRLVAIASRHDAERSVVAVAIAAAGDAIAGAEGALVPDVLKAPRDLGLDPAGVSTPRPVTFPSAGGRMSHAWFYAPAGLLDGEPLEGLPGEAPPLITMIHGGPTSAADPSFTLAVQFWTSRGFAVVDVDYGGSTGYGRAYRRLLNDAWGIVDVDDACAAAAWLGAQGLVDPQRLAITGGSAGGFTVLCCLATRDTFAAGASHFGVADLGALARDTHKFESRYCDRLVGPWPEAKDVYDARSPLHHVGGFDRPLIVLQGLEDEVVPPAQSQMIVDALAAKGVPHAYLTFEGEQHGFRIAANIIRALSAELSFYAQVFHFELADAATVEPVEIVFGERL